MEYDTVLVGGGDILWITQLHGLVLQCKKSRPAKNIAKDLTVALELGLLKRKLCKFWFGVRCKITAISRFQWS